MRPERLAMRFLGLAEGHPDYARQVADHLVDWVAMPAIAGRMVIIEDDIAFTWCYAAAPLVRAPTSEDWLAPRGEIVWLADVVAAKGTSGTTVGKKIRAEMARRGITKPRQSVIFWRNGKDRYGAFAGLARDPRIV